MKLIYAGIKNTDTYDFSKYLFNCIRNPACQKAYYVPLKDWTDLLFYADLPFGKPTTITASIVNTCGGASTFQGEFSNEFSSEFDLYVLLSSGAYLTEYPITFTQYLIGQKPDGSWFGVFGAAVPTIPDGTDVPCFFIKLTLNNGVNDYQYYSEQMCFSLICDTITKLQGCYPNEEIGADATDINGIYYGIPVNDDILGKENYRYFHWAYVRDMSITPSKFKLSFTLFNSQRVFKNQARKEWLAEFELVPSFYADVIVGIMNRGNIKIDGVDYLVQEEQDYSILDTTTKLWKLDTTLFKLTRNWYSCGQSDCSLPPLRCRNNPTRIAYSKSGSINTFTFTDGSLGTSEVIEWQILDGVGSILLSGNVITSSPFQFTFDSTSFPLIDPLFNCYRVKWRKNCFSGEAYSTYNTFEWGSCSDNGCCNPLYVRAFLN